MNDIKPWQKPFYALLGISGYVLILPIVGIVEFQFKGLGIDTTEGRQMYDLTRYR